VQVLGRKCRPRRIFSGLASGYRICVSPAENLAYVLGTAEPSLQRAIRRYVFPGDVVYDIGANIGYVSLSLARQVGSRGKVIAFEPVPQTFDLLCRNIELNHTANITPLNAAASDRTGETSIRVTSNLSMASLVWHRNDFSAAELPVRTVRVDELVKRGELERPSFVKIDVEGAEGMVIAGLENTLARARPVIYLECSERGRQITWPMLHDLKYRCQSPGNRQWIDNFEEYRHADFLWLPAK